MFTDVEFKYVYTDNERAALASLEAALDPEEGEPDLAAIAHAADAAETYADHPALAEVIGIARKVLARSAQVPVEYDFT